MPRVGYLTASTDSKSVSESTTSVVRSNDVVMDSVPRNQLVGVRQLSLCVTCPSLASDSSSALNSIDPRRNKEINYRKK